jgi:hypothetical protein
MLNRTKACSCSRSPAPASASPGETPGHLQAFQADDSTSRRHGGTGQGSPSARDSQRARRRDRGRKRAGNGSTCSTCPSETPPPAALSRSPIIKADGRSRSPRRALQSSGSPGRGGPRDRNDLLPTTASCRSSRTTKSSPADRRRRIPAAEGSGHGPGAAAIALARRLRPRDHLTTASPRRHRPAPPHPPQERPGDAPHPGARSVDGRAERAIARSALGAAATTQRRRPESVVTKLEEFLPRP